MVFISFLGVNEGFVQEVEMMCLANGLSSEKLIIVGEKNFGESNGQIYAKRNQPNYFEQYIEVADKERFINQNRHFSEIYGDRFIDLMGMVTNNENKVRVFTPDHHFMSADCKHLSKGGAIFFSKAIDWEKYVR